MVKVKRGRAGELWNWGLRVPIHKNVRLIEVYVFVCLSRQGEAEVEWGIHMYMYGIYVGWGGLSAWCFDRRRLAVAAPADFHAN